MSLLNVGYYGNEFARSVARLLAHLLSPRTPGKKEVCVCVCLLVWIIFMNSCVSVFLLRLQLLYRAIIICIFI